MKRILFAVLGCGLLLASCERDGWDSAPSVAEETPAAFRLNYTAYDGDDTRSAALRTADYDRVEFRVIDASGAAVTNLKGLYDPAASELRIEGLRDGEYRLLVLGIRGDEREDRATIRPIGHIDETWLSFPEDLGKPLDAEYFYSQTPFTVRVETGSSGIPSTVITGTETVQQRIVGRADFTFSYENPYVRTAEVSKRATLSGMRFRTGLTGSGSFVGESDELSLEVDLAAASGYLFLPSLETTALRGEIEIETRTYRGGQVRRLLNLPILIRVLQRRRQSRQLLQQRRDPLLESRQLIVQPATFHLQKQRRLEVSRHLDMRPFLQINGYPMFPILQKERNAMKPTFLLLKIKPTRLHARHRIYLLIVVFLENSVNCLVLQIRKLSLNPVDIILAT